MGIAIVGHTSRGTLVDTIIGGCGRLGKIGQRKTLNHKAYLHNSLKRVLSAISSSVGASGAVALQEKDIGDIVKVTDRQDKTL